VFLPHDFFLSLSLSVEIEQQPSMSGAAESEAKLAEAASTAAEFETQARIYANRIGFSFVYAYNMALFPF
jgi:hypothetical protein